MSLVRTDDVLTEEKLREAIGLEDDEQIESDTLNVCAGEWRRNQDGLWVFWRLEDWE